MSFNKKLFVGAIALFSLLLSGPLSHGQGFQLGVSATPDPVNIGSTLTYTIYVTNQYQFPSFNVYVTNRFSADVVFTLQNSSFGEDGVTNGNDIIFRIPEFQSAAGSNFGTFSFLLIPTTAGSLANQITILDTNQPNTIRTTNFVTQVTAPTADLAIGMTNLVTGAFAGGTNTIGLTVTNLGPNEATGVVATSILPTSFQLLSVTPANASTTFANGFLTWTIGSLTNGQVTQLLVSVRPTNGGPFNLSSVVSASTVDNITTNNVVTNSMIVEEVVSTNLVIAGVTAQQFNPQTGLMEHVVTVRNDGTNAVPAVRLFVTGLGTNLLYNAVGTNSNIPYVQHNATLAIGASVPMRLEYYVRSRTPLTNLTYAAAGVTFTSPTVPTSSSPTIISQQLNSGGFLIEFQSIPGRSYTILYADNIYLTNAQAAQPSVVAPADRVQWIDNGPPKTTSPPAVTPQRYYRVLLNP